MKLRALHAWCRSPCIRTQHVGKQFALNISLFWRRNTGCKWNSGIANLSARLRLNRTKPETAYCNWRGRYLTCSGNNNLSLLRHSRWRFLHGRSAPEVILDGYYTHASDVWSFGILAWELYTSFADGLDGRDSSLPFFDLDNQEVNCQFPICNTTNTKSV